MPLLRSLEGLRLVASLGIVSIHMLPHVGLNPPGGLDLFVDMFFVVSGIVIGNLYVGRIRTLADYGLFLRRRLARIYPLHLATLLFYVALGVVMARNGLASTPGRFDHRQILPNLLMVHAWGPDGRLTFNFPSWSISAEFFVYLAFPAIAFLVGRGLGAGLAGVALLLAGAVTVAALAGGPLYALRWNLGEVRAVPSFAFGVWLAAVAPPLADRRWARHMPAALVLLAAAAAVGSALGTAMYLLLALLWGVVATAYVCDLRGAATFLAWRPLSARGYLTYSLYLLHVPVATVFLSYLFPRLLGQSEAARWLSLAGALAILFALAELSFRKFEDPLRRRLR